MRLNRVVRFLPLAALVALPVSFVAPALAQAGPYAVVDHWQVGGEGGWDY